MNFALNNNLAERSIFISQLVPDEQLLWVGKPVPHLFALYGLMRFIGNYIFGALMVAFVVAFFAFFPHLLGSLLFYVSVPVLLICSVLCICCLFLTGFLEALRTGYALTNLRVMIYAPVVFGLGPCRTTSYGLGILGPVDCHTFLKGQVGDVILAHISRPAWYSTRTGSKRTSVVVRIIGFWAVQDAQELADKIAVLSAVAWKQAHSHAREKRYAWFHRDNPDE